MTVGPVTIEAVQEGFRTSRDYTISPEIYAHFLGAYADLNPMHTNDTFARSHGFSERIMQGTILNGFISHFIGVHFPGGAVLLHSVSVQYKAPCYLGDAIRIDAAVTQVTPSVGVITMEMELRNVTRDRTAAKAKVQVGLL
jgi:3-hydroxybutyryl-CoA dehydratase